MSSSSPTPQTDHIKNNNAGLNKQHLIIALGVGLSVVTLIIMCLLLSIFVNNRHSNSDNSERRRFRPSRSKKPKKSPSERRLRKLDAESPICTLEEWWSRAKIPPLPSDDESDQFTCAICLDSVLRSHEIRDLKCLHVFHRECLDKWYLQDQFHCPLCHRAYFKQQFQPTNEFVWMV
ncbi:putative RING finger domain protein [Aspergillus glaucus CBS 516.65]|uniref:RING-type domain-containing protein n=1 Tax=Aspergillus glaucus CBS 516.65 TaxID=1160497 RepID=A0A1L9VU05_ASPGL|nr:hypothetical protein ASPGLDRAFT_64531 [Aspergillus glaucus CBS 516.65]OJJ87382.1 hypothetical protein ASPGLDRAFT_64531 [Aspergillus glaucus CBS 516.65]